MTVFRLLLFFSLLILLSACGRWIVGDNPRNTPTANFDVFVETVRQNYAFFPEKGVEWDALVADNRPLVHDSLSNDSLFVVLSDMLGTLRDGHVNLYSDFNRSRNHDWFVDFPPNADTELLLRRYWGKDYESSGTLIHNWVRDSVGYVYYGSFRGAFTNRQLNYVLNRYRDAKGLIIDVRTNGGGSMNRMYTLVRRFLPEPTVLGKMQYKNGPGPNEFSAFDTIRLEPTIDYAKRDAARAKKAAKRKKKKPKPEKKTKPNEKPRRVGAGQWMTKDTTTMWLDRPVVILTGRRSYSAANFFSGLMSTLPHVTLIGDRTGGGGGVPVSFELPNGWKFRISATRTYLPDGTDIENGVEPDIYQDAGPSDYEKGKDAIIERAVDFILSGRSDE